ncbi:MAG: hypothetical protein FWF52_09255 [Candidatus Azobacteroides sp.]|nr:hypothetical protein [Candidatus Azobacteroides sp.]
MKNVKLTVIGIALGFALLLACSSPEAIPAITSIVQIGLETNATLTIIGLL